MSLNLDFSNFNVDLSGLGDFSLDSSNLSPLLQDTTSDPSPLDIRKAEIAAKAGQQAPQAVRQTADLTNYYDALREGTTVTDIDTVGQSYDQVLNETLAAQGIVDTDYAEGGGAGVSKPTVSAFTAPDYAPRELGEFQGNLSAHTSSSLGQIKEFQARLEPLMAPEMARLQTQEKLDYKDAVEQAYLQNPEIQALYNEYDVKPFRATEDGSIYLYDPFTFGEIRTLEVKDNDLKKAIKAVTQIGVSILTGGAGATMGLTGAAAAATSAAVSGFTTAAYGGDKDAILNSVLMAGGTSLLKGAVEKVREGVENVAEETLQTVSPELSVELPEIVSAEAAEAAVANPSSVIDLAGDPSAFAGIDVAALTPEVTQGITDIQYRALNDVVERLGGGTEGTSALNSMTNEQLARNLRAAGDIEGLNALGLAEVGERTTGFYSLNPSLRSDLVREAVSYVGPSFSPDTFMEITEDTIPFDRPSSRVTVDVSNLEDTPVTQPQPTRESFLPSDQPSGGGGGAAGGTGLAGGATTTTSGSVSVTPTIDYTAPGAVTSSLFADVLNTAAAVNGVVTLTSPLTPITTTAFDQESYTTTRPTSILENTTDDTTTAPDTTGGGSTGGVDDPVSTGGAEGGGAEGGASGGADDGSGTEGDGASGQEGGDDTAGDGTAAGGGAGDTGDAEGAGDGTGEGEGTGDGTGTGDGSGDGTGDGSGSGDGTGEGLGGAGGGGTGGGLFSDYVDPYNAPGLLNRALPLEGYSPIDVANEIKKLRSFSFLQPEQVKESLSLFGNPLLEESVMKKLYKTGN